MAAGVFAGAKYAIQDAFSKSGKPDSASVGTSGSTAIRLWLATAMTRSEPCLIRGNAVGTVVVVRSTCWPATAVTGAAPPWYGTCVASKPDTALNRYSDVRCSVVPTPAVEYVKRPFFAPRR